jgi:hypothetical protein
VSGTFDGQEALAAASLVWCAYDAYASLADKSVLTPPVALPPGQTLVSWITIDDFMLVPGKAPERRFYGFVARDVAGDYTLVIRGAEGLLEWWDAVHVLLVPFKKGTQFGNVAEGFERIYRTLDFVSVDAQGRVSAPRDIDPSLTPASSFAAKARAVIRNDAQRFSARTAEEAAVTVAGHSLGGALVTLFVAENVTVDALHVRAAYTFASPRVGDRAFAEAYATLQYNGAPLQTLRVANRPDLVPKIPLAIEGFTHVGKRLELDSRASDAIAWTIPCFHNLTSYMMCLGAPEPANWQCDASHVNPLLAEVRTLARNVLGIEAGRTVVE